MPDLTEAEFRDAAKDFRALGPDGIAEVNEKVSFNNVLINRKTPANTSDLDWSATTPGRTYINSATVYVSVELIYLVQY